MVVWEKSQWGKKSFTDIDAMIEYKDKYYIFIEVKHTNGKLTTGQKILLERLVDSISNKKRKAIALVAKHSVRYPENIELTDCEVTDFYYKGVWKKPKKLTRVNEVVLNFTNNFDGAEKPYDYKCPIKSQTNEEWLAAYGE